jgi:ENTH domain
LPQAKLIMQALVLLEYLIKNGSERVVDDARSHIATIKILRNFHFIDDKGKDQGINGKTNEEHANNSPKQS